MSLLNDVLKELDRRKAPPDPRGGLTMEVRHVQAPRGPFFGQVRALLLCLLLVGAGLLALRTESGRAVLQSRFGATGSTQTPPQLSPPSPPPETVVQSEAPPPDPPIEVNSIETPPALAVATVAAPVPALASGAVRQPAAPLAPKRPTRAPSPLPDSGEASPATSVIAIMAAPDTAAIGAPRPAPAPPTTTLPDAGAAQAVLKLSTPSQQGQALLETARVRLAQGNHAGAIRQLEEALAVAPELYSARHLLLVTYLEKGQATKALVHLVAGLDMQPNDPFLLAVRTRMALDRGDAQDAATSARDALGRHPDNDSLHGLLALSLLASGEAQAAITHFQRTLAKDSLSPTGLIGLAAALEQVGLAADARQALLRARGSGRLNTAQQAYVDSQLESSGP